MREMENIEKLTDPLKKRMFRILLVTSTIMAFCITLALFIFLMLEAKEDAFNHSRYLASYLARVMDPGLVNKQDDLARIMADYSKHYGKKRTPLNIDSKISSIKVYKIYNEDNQLIYNEKFFEPAILDIQGSAEVIKDGLQLGYVEVSKRTYNIVIFNIFLLLLLLLIGLLISTGIYYYTIGFVIQTEIRIVNAFKKLQFYSYFDPLTNLPNRIKFYDDLVRLLREADQAGQILAIMIIDLDSFKDFDDLMGHEQGDLLLQNVARRVKGLIREEDVLARLGGDEFVIVLPNICDLNEATAVADRIVASMAQPVVIGDEEVYMTVSIGISSYPAHGNTVENLIKNAETAIYRAKELGKNRRQVFTATLKQDEIERRTIENCLRDALKNHDGLYIYYQPVFELDSGALSGAAARVFLQVPGGKELAYGQFVRLAEQTGLINPLSEWILRAVCMQNKTWHESGYSLCVSIDISARYFQRTDVIEVISETLDMIKLDPQLLQLTLSQQSELLYDQYFVPKIRGLMQKQIKVAVASFDEGIFYLMRKCQLTTLKISKEYLTNIPQSKPDAAIIKNMIGLAHELGIRITARGIETEEQLTFLRRYKCDEVQGKLLGIAQPADEFAQKLAEGKINTWRLQSNCEADNNE